MNRPKLRARLESIRELSLQLLGRMESSYSYSDAQLEELWDEILDDTDAVNALFRANRAVRTDD